MKIPQLNTSLSILHLSWIPFELNSKTFKEVVLCDTYYTVHNIMYVTYESQSFMVHMQFLWYPKENSYSFVRFCSQKFPWGDGNHSLLHNPRKNALKEGYESSE